MPWLNVGDAGIFFLMSDPANSPEYHYDVVAPPGQVLIQDQQVRTRGPDPVTTLLNRMSPTELRDSIREAVTDAEAGRARPLVPKGLRGDDK